MNASRVLSRACRRSTKGSNSILPISTSTSQLRNQHLSKIFNPFFESPNKLPNLHHAVFQRRGFSSSVSSQFIRKNNSCANAASLARSSRKTKVFYQPANKPSESVRRYSNRTIKYGLHSKPSTKSMEAVEEMSILKYKRVKRKYQRLKKTHEELVQSTKEACDKGFVQAAATTIYFIFFYFMLDKISSQWFDDKQKPKLKLDAKQEPNQKLDGEREPNPKLDVKQEPNQKLDGKREPNPKLDVKRESTPKLDDQQKPTPKLDVKQELTPKQDDQQKPTPKLDDQQKPIPKLDDQQQSTPKSDDQQESTPKLDDQQESTLNLDGSYEPIPKKGKYLFMAVGLILFFQHFYT